MSGSFLIIPEKKVPKELLDLRNKIFAIIDGKTAKQLFLEFKQAEEYPVTGETKPKVGRMKGQGGASAAQRAAAQAKLESAQTEALELKADELIGWIDEHCDDKHIGQLSDTTRKKLLERGELLVSYLRNLVKKEGK